MDNSDLARGTDRLNATRQIQQLASRYALTLDSRNMDDMVSLFIEDVQLGRDRFGREALREHFHKVLSPFTTSFHLIGNHTIDFDDDDHAHGIVYCRAEHEDREHWVVAALHYWDTYERRQGRWYFARRKVVTLYVADMLERPVGPVKRRWPGRPQQVCELPAAWPTWKRFWDRQGVANPPMG